MFRSCRRVLIGSLEATYNVHLRLSGKLVVDFLFVLSELFSLGIRLKIGVFEGTGPVWLQKSVERVVPNQQFI